VKNLKEPGRIVLVTGAAGGIGSAITDSLLKAGHAVAALDRDAAALERLNGKHGAEKDRLLPIQGELTDPAVCADSVARTVAQFGRIDGVVNNAGIGPSSIRPDAETKLPALEEMTPDLWDRFFAINVRAPMLVTRAALPHMKLQNFGRVINNTTSYRTMLRVLPYGATKSALESMSAVWAAELKDHGITVNVLIPGGPTDTPFISDAAGWPRDKMIKPMVMGPPAIWLMSDAAAEFTGQRITAGRWDMKIPAAQAAKLASRAIGWPELTADAVWLQS
jgi:NAD(P)-dependent dehydrogenase (short-subunit alcohol dehydrogenase family)